jgi:PAS domain S-box-containing protein
MAKATDLPVPSTEIDFKSIVTLEPITVLHVDDEPDFAEITAEFLTRANSDLEVLTETNAEAALERLNDDTVSIDCIVSDYLMPGMDGIEFLETVREESPDLPFILFTGQGSEEVAGRAISAGVTDYLQKESGIDQYAVLANRIANSAEKTHAERNGEQLLCAIETAREGISLLDEDGRFLYVNSSYAETYGYDQEDLLGEHWEILYPADQVEHVYEDLLPNIPDDGVLREQTTMITSDGSEIATDHALSYTPGGLIVCNTTPILEKIDRHGLLANVFNALDDLLFFFDEDGTLEFWNEEVEVVTGYSPAELPELTPTDFVHDDDRDAMEDYVWTTHKTGQARVEVQLKRESGETVPYEFISKRVLNDRGDVIGRIGLGRDITERKQYERQIERHNERLEHFAEILSHDLRNPLSVADGYLTLLNETGDEAHYETAETALDRMKGLITDILELAQSGELISADDYETIELEVVAESAWSMIQQEAATLEVTSTATVDADASRLQQILENLFRNAIEHGEEDISLRTGVLSSADGIFVADDGPGIPESERESVFEPGHSTKQNGTGFGLATVKQLVEAHEWEVRITESPTGGARFEIYGVDFTTQQKREIAETLSIPATYEIQISETLQLHTD